MTDDFGARVVARASSHIGVSFRLHGRTAKGGLDCVGLVSDALQAVGFHADIVADYSLRGRFEECVSAFFDRAEFAKIEACETLHSGDIALVQTAPRQLHLIIYAGDGFVHAHAGLRRVVLTPGPVPWPVVGRWRYIGD